MYVIKHFHIRYLKLHTGYKSDLNQMSQEPRPQNMHERWNFQFNHLEIIIRIILHFWQLSDDLFESASIFYWTFWRFCIGVLVVFLSLSLFFFPFSSLWTFITKSRVYANNQDEPININTYVFRRQTNEMASLHPFSSISPVQLVWPWFPKSPFKSPNGMKLLLQWNAFGYRTIYKYKWCLVAVDFFMEWLPWLSIWIAYCLFQLCWKSKWMRKDGK